MNLGIKINHPHKPKKAKKHEKKEVPFVSAHKLDFEIAPYDQPIEDGFEWVRFRVGTCTGLWTYTGNSYDILSVENSVPGNGHFEDVLQWFEQSCRRERVPLRIIALMNERFRNHLISKRGFAQVPHVDILAKFFN